MSEEQLSVGNEINSPEKQNKWYLSAIDFIAKASGVLVALLYFSGLVIVNANFSKYGLSKISLANSKYLIAGVWYIVILAICYRIYLELARLYSAERPVLSSLLVLLLAFVQLFVISTLLSFVGNRGQRLPAQLGIEKIYNIIWWSLIILGVIGWLISSIWKNKQVEVLTNWISATNYGIWTLMLFNAGELVFLISAFGLLRISKVTIQNYLEKKDMAEQLANVLIVLLFSLWIFGRYVYAEISPEFGGGKLVPVEVRLKQPLSKEAITSIDSSVLKCNLIDRTDESIVVMSDSLTNYKAIEIRSDNILAVNYVDASSKISSLGKFFEWIENISKSSAIDTVTSNVTK